MESRRIRTVIIGSAGAAAAVFLLGFVVFASVATRTANDFPPPSDGIVVLTGGEARIAEAGRLLENGVAHRLLISGVNRKTSREDLRRLMKIDAKLFDCCVDIGYEALDTIGNADEARNWAGKWHFSKLVVVTACYHMPRSLAQIALAMPNATLVPHAVVPRQLIGAPWWLRLAAARTLVAEYLKFLPVASQLALSRLQGREKEATGNGQGVDRVPGSGEAALRSMRL